MPLKESYRLFPLDFGTALAVRLEGFLAARFAGFLADFPAPIAFGRACRGW
jgi:hypothetical protein